MAQPAEPDPPRAGRLGLKTFPHELTSARAARVWVCGLLGGVSDSVLADVAVVVSELVTNAVVHTETLFVSVDVTFDGDVLKVEVIDDGSGEWGEPDAKREGGRGLALVEAFSDCWGVRHERLDRTVWFELKITGR